MWVAIVLPFVAVGFSSACVYFLAILPERKLQEELDEKYGRSRYSRPKKYTNVHKTVKKRRLRRDGY